MTRLRTTLADLAEDAPEPTTSLAERAIGITRRRRRTRWIVAPALAAAVALAAVPLVQHRQQPVPEIATPVRPLPDRGAGTMKDVALVQCGANCMKWRLIGQDGVQWEVNQALASYPPKGAQGYITAPLTLSDDGDHIAYYRAADRQLVVRDLEAGTVTPVRTDRVPPSKADVGDMGLTLSADGSQLVIVYTSMGLGSDKPNRALYVDLATGRTTRLPERCCVRIVTRDRVVMEVEHKNWTDLVTVGLDGRSIAKVSIPPGPQGSSTDSGALSSDGRLLARLADTSKTSPMNQLAVLDLETRTWTSSVRLALPTMRPVDVKKGTGTMPTIRGWLNPTTVRVDVYPLPLAMLPDDRPKLLDRLPAEDKTIHAYAVDVRTGQGRLLETYQFTEATAQGRFRARHQAQYASMSE
ncbi:hypothetical protein [Nonomuraea sediminis]|uniref:hypothetical protein n=1 Tax=Nonomuraea sediminis TaxID=2835864 RepID=UPI001BDCD51E|nr:hypothetical protein [Nonomuraea sediminis]